MASDSDVDRKVQLRVSNHKAYVWNVEGNEKYRYRDVTRKTPHLRRSDRNTTPSISAKCIPRVTASATSRGGVLLLEKQLAILIDDPNVHPSPSAEDLRSWNAEREILARQQIAVAEAEKMSEKASKLSSSEAAIRKRKDREAKRAAAARAKALAEGVPVDDPTAIPPQPLLSATEDRAATPKATAPVFNVTIPASSSDLPWYAPNPCTYSTLEAARQAGIWTYPTTAYERAKCRVFQDLWENGNCMGGGIKFGGDFLVYPGDPLRYHSHFVASVIESPHAPLTPMEIVAHGRLGTATKKAHLFCEWNEDSHEVTYFSVEWAGFG